MESNYDGAKCEVGTRNAKDDYVHNTLYLIEIGKEGASFISLAAAFKLPFGAFLAPSRLSGLFRPLHVLVHGHATLVY